MLVAFGSLSKSSVLVRSSIGPFRSFLYFGILLTKTIAISQKLTQRGALERLYLQSEDLDVFILAVTAESGCASSFCREVLFLYTCIAPFSLSEASGSFCVFYNFFF